MLQSHHRLAILLHHGTVGAKGKTGLALLRYSENPIVAVIDEACPGGDVPALTGIDRPVPIVGSMAAALDLKPDVLAIGLAPSGGSLPAPWYAEVRQAVAAGVSVMNGLHMTMSADPDMVNQLQPNQWIWDMRQEPAGLTVGSGQARTLDCRRVLAVGTDMAVGKMSTCIELHRATRRRGLPSKLVATGQTALMLGADGIPLDAVRIDFASGAVEQAVMRNAPGQDVIYVEGQGSIFNPASTATLPLLRGTQPTHLVLVHKLGMDQLQFLPDFQLPSLSQVVQIYETLAAAGGTFAAVKVAGVALNTFGVDDAVARDAIAAVSQATGLPCTDVVRFGAEPILSAILAN
ncbi:MAG: DUF1611 domain-containing protein [Cyanobacteria bacterium P01_A01_bin.105]